MFGSLLGKAKALTEVVAERVVTAKDAVTETVGDGASSAVQYIESHWGTIEKVVVDGLLTVAHDRLKDDEVYLMAVDKAFELLPTPVRLLLPRSAFHKHSLTHRDTVIKHLASKQAERQAISQAMEINGPVHRAEQTA
ncbi:hypothetical protein [Pseudomonas oryzihabitans]|uniref:Uncharacterized protein n=1 Tax=Pseudomonas oryzihabitans TaxID=47885 RepID=A0ABX3IS32_9PSED|nr:hypothetical protein [Pseudomonas psychrotolerans]ONN70679.1 hypothetical protein BVL52_20815 [Pseudomonas psychrotolerans]